MDTYEDIPRLVSDWSDGSQEAFDRLVTLLYDDLRDLAHAHLRSERTGHTLDTTALVHEAYVRLAGHTGPSWRGRPRFFAFLSRVMRHVLVDYARRRAAGKRQVAQVPLTAGSLNPGLSSDAIDLLAMNEALDRLEEKSSELAAIVECRFFGGLTTSETAEALGISPRTVDRGWQRARSYLFQLLAPEPLKAE